MTFQPARALAVLAMSLTAPAFATTIQATFTSNDYDGGAYSATLSNIHYAAGSTGDALPSFSQVICIDHGNFFPSSGTTRTYTLQTDATGLVAHSAAGARATDLFNYVVDRYYDTAVQGNGADYSGWQFNKALWEIASDFDGTSRSLSTQNGSIYASGYQLYDTIVGDLRDNLSTIAVGYRSSAYTVSFLDDQSSGYQSMMMLSPVAAVPEPGTYALMLGGLGLVGAIARRRAARTQG